MLDTSSSEGPGKLRRKFSSRKDISRGSKNEGSEENKYDAISSITDDPHVAAHIVKDFLRKLDEPLFPISINAQLIAAVKEVWWVWGEGRGGEGKRRLGEGGEGKRGITL